MRSFDHWHHSGWWRSSRLGAGLSFALLVACSSSPPPPALSSLDQSAESPQGVEAKRLAPQAYRHARQLAVEAREAHEAGNDELATVLAEQAQAELEQAFVLARAAKADARKTAAQRAVNESSASLRAIDAQQATLLAQTEAVELRIRVIRDALPLSPSGKATPEREQARRQAARALVGDARLLCVAAQLLQGEKAVPAEGDSLRKQLVTVANLEREIEQSWRTVPIDAASKARSECLNLLSATRKAKASTTELLPVDALLDELARAEQQPQRDDRGVVVTLRSAFEGNQLAPAAQKRLEVLARVAASHPHYPVLLVLHQARGKATAADNEKLNGAQQALRAAGAPRVTGELAGSAQPLVPTGHPRAASENARLEVVFVAPSW